MVRESQVEQGAGDAGQDGGRGLQGRGFGRVERCPEVEQAREAPHGQCLDSGVFDEPDEGDLKRLQATRFEPWTTEGKMGRRMRHRGLVEPRRRAFGCILQKIRHEHDPGRDRDPPRGPPF